MAAYRDLLRDEVLRAARPDDRCGLAGLPDGEATYDAALRYFTTTTMSAQEIHSLGLAQIEKLADEYRALGPEVVGTDDLVTIFESMRSDPALHFTEGQQLVTASETAMARAWAAMPDWFEVLPQAPCVVEATMSGPRPSTSRPPLMAAAAARSSSTSTTPARGAPSNSRRWLSTRASRATTSRSRSRRNSPGCRRCASTCTTRRTPRVGALHRAAGRRDGPLLGSRGPDGDVRRRLDACLSPRRRHRAARARLESPAGSRIHAGQLSARRGRGPARGRPVRRVAGPGVLLHGRPGRDRADASRGRGPPGRRFSIKAFHSAVLDSGSLPLGVLDEVVRTRLP